MAHYPFQLHHLPEFDEDEDVVILRYLKVVVGRREDTFTSASPGLRVLSDSPVCTC